MNSYQVHAWYYPNFYTFSDILNGKRCKSNYKITDTAIINSWIIEEKNTKGICRVNWDLVDDNFIECSKVYKTYLSNGFLGSKISLGKKLINIGIISSTKYINGLTVYVYVGITDKIPIDFINE